MALDADFVNPAEQLQNCLQDHSSVHVPEVVLWQSADQVGVIGDVEMTGYHQGEWRVVQD